MSDNTSSAISSSGVYSENAASQEGKATGFNYTITTEDTAQSCQVYRVTIGHHCVVQTWFVLHHYSGFERLSKFLRQNVSHAEILKRHGFSKLPKRTNFIRNLLTSTSKFNESVDNLVRIVLSEHTLLKVPEIKTFFGIDRHTDYPNLSLTRSFSSSKFLNEQARIADYSDFCKYPDKLNDQKTAINTNSESWSYEDSTCSEYDDSWQLSNPNGNCQTKPTNPTKKNDRGPSMIPDMNDNIPSLALRQNIRSGQKKSYYDLAGTCNVRISPANFRFLHVIGRGSFGKVLLANNKDNYFAIKVLHKSTIIKKNEQKHIMSERNVLTQTLSHPFLVRLHYSFQTRSKLYFVLDYVNGGELFYHLQKVKVFTEERARFYAAEIGSAIGYMHRNDILYRDLKPENLLLDYAGHIVLTDFGLCKERISNGDKTGTFCGTPEYLAPEVLQKQPYDKAIDWWCFGAVLYEMIYGLPPFYSKNVHEMYQAIATKQLMFPCSPKPKASLKARQIIVGLLQKNPTERLGSGVDDFQEIQAMPFFESLNWHNLLTKKIKPPYIPSVNGIADVGNIDPHFKSETVTSSIMEGRGQTPIPSNAFLGFTYVRPHFDQSSLIH